MTTTKQILADLKAIDVTSAEMALADAEARRQGALLTAKTDEEILAAEADITRFRIARDRAVARKADLERQLVEAERHDREQAFRKRYADAARMADEAERAIRVEFPSFALRVIDIAEKERQADDALIAINAELADNDIDLTPIVAPADRLWAGKFLRKVLFRDLVSLPETDDSPAFGAAVAEVTMEAARALGGVGQPAAMPVHQFV
jgi:hypothetical protein